jgi:modulator of FtsH protease
MNQYQQPTQYQDHSTSGAVVRNRVLRNTYMLLAISMIPTVIGAWLALKLGLNQLFSPGVSMIFFMGMMLSRMLGFVLSLNDGANLIMLAFGGTAAIFATMAAVATTAKRDFSNMTKTLLIGAVIIIVAAIANVFLMIPALTLTISVLAIVIFSAFLLVDIQRIVNGGETNYISATLSVYLSLYNIFASLLSILGITSND